MEFLVLKHNMGHYLWAGTRPQIMSHVVLQYKKLHNLLSKTFFPQKSSVFLIFFVRLQQIIE